MSPKDNEKLLPCPLCGSDKISISSTNILCLKCRLYLSRKFKADLIKAWNTRPQPSTQKYPDDRYFELLKENLENAKNNIEKYFNKKHCELLNEAVNGVPDNLNPEHPNWRNPSTQNWGEVEDLLHNIISNIDLKESDILKGKKLSVISSDKSREIATQIMSLLRKYGMPNNIEEILRGIDKYLENVPVSFSSPDAVIVNIDKLKSFLKERLK